VRVVILSPFQAERTALEALLRGEGHDVVSATDREQGLTSAMVARPEAVIADAALAGPDGLALVRELARLAPPPRMILLCARWQRWPQLPGVVCMTKPIDLARLYDHLTPPARAKVCTR
jgi:DNA-binding response OmpR family regulator